MTDVTTLIMPMIVIAFGIFAGAMYFYRKMTAGETFSYEKFALTMGYGAIASLVLYLAAGALPSVDQVIAEIEVLAPGGAASVTALISAFLVIYNAATKYFTGSSSITTTSTTPAAATTVTETKFDPGFTVTPTDLSIKSGTAIALSVVTGVATTILTIDWQDGVIETIPLSTTSAGKVASPTHTYTYVQGTSQYTGHTFYPKFTVSNGTQSKIFNDVANGQGAACAIFVSI